MPDSLLKSKINEAMKEAMRAKDKMRLGAIRLALSEMKRIEVDERIDLDEERVISILDKMVKQRRDSIRQFEAGGRNDLAEVEQQEIDVLQEFMPTALDAAELSEIIKAAVTETGANNMKDMGKLMAVVRPKVIGRTDMAEVSKQIKAMLG